MVAIYCRLVVVTKFNVEYLVSNKIKRPTVVHTLNRWKLPSASSIAVTLVVVVRWVLARSNDLNRCVLSNSIEYDETSTEAWQVTEKWNNETETNTNIQEQTQSNKLTLMVLNVVSYYSFNGDLKPTQKTSQNLHSGAWLVTITWRFLQTFLIPCTHINHINYHSQNISHWHCLFHINWIELCSVLGPCQHSIGYMGDDFYRSKDPTNSIKVLKEVLQNTKQITKTTKYTNGHTMII